MTAHIRWISCCILLLAIPMMAYAQIEPAPDRAEDEGEGPYDRLVLRGATLIDGTGAPPRGPVDIVVEDNEIVNIVNVGVPGVPIDDDARPEPADRDLDVEGKYVLPGFVDMHGHLGGERQGTPAEYVLKLWKGHGITTVRDPGSGNGIEWMLEHRERSENNEIVAPRLEAYFTFGMGWDEPIATAEQAREWVRWIADQGADGIKFFGARPAVLQAAIEEANEQGLGTAMHHAQLDVARTDVLDTASWGLTSMEHWYGLPEALFTDRTVQDYPTDYNYENEQHRFAEAGRLWKQAAEPHSDHWNAVMDSLLALDFTINPTFNIYEASRDLMRGQRAEWHDDYTLPSLEEFFEPDREDHGSYFFYWTTEDEIEWRNNYDIWMEFIEEYKNRGGRVTAGSDSGFIYQVYGFGFIRELEMLQEAGFHPLEVIKSATLKGAEAIGRDDEIGSVEVGKKADFVVVDENPLENLKVLYGTGAPKLDDETNEMTRVGGVDYTIKDGIIYDAEALLEDVRAIVDEAE